MFEGVTITVSMKSNNLAISTLSFIISVIIILSNSIAIIFKFDLNGTSLIMSFVLSIILFMNGILYRQKALDKNKKGSGYLD